jgi:hypothetical protein
MHQLPKYAGALFQVASQFNLLEMVSPEITPEHGVTRYQHDRTQGPACAIAAGAATIYRNYFAPISGSPVALTNRGSDPMPLAQFAWKKCEDDGLIVARLGVLDNDLGKVWQPTQPHVAVRQLREWFTQFPYLSKLREPQVLAKAISEALARSDAKYGIADHFDEAKGEYVGLRLAQLVTIDLNSDVLLVHREVADAQLATQVPQTAPLGTGNIGETVTRQPSISGPLPAGAPRAARPRRFYAKVALDPNRPTPQVSNIAQSILSELDRARGTTIMLTLDIAAETVDGFSEDVETIVRDNAASLRITDFGFEEE